ncbi:MAG: carotenoid oxygenase family protein [Kastovskya adunca ATA6-11-RM4]|nr:carotenoid oxygenase family protein [Kastovskya adunca ATA6-11-RM4]
MTTTTATNPFLSGNFAPMRSEITESSLKVIGQLPPDLSGWFVRNGPNPQFPPQGRYHWFDGDGMLHGVQISDGKAQYRNRYIETRGYKLEREAGEAIWTGLLEPPKRDNPHGPSKNVANTALVWHDGRLLALWEGGAPHEIKLPGLETVGSYNYNGQLTSAFTAHPKVDALSGEMMFFGYSFFQSPYLHYSIVSATGELLRTVPIDLPVGVMMHDFAITEHYTVFMDLPLTFRPERMQRGEPVLQFEASRPSRFGILPRHGDNSRIRWFEAPACYVFHTLNAYEEGEEVVLVACRMNSTTVLAASEHGEAGGDTPYLHRWRFNLTTGEVKEEALSTMASDFPRINEQYMGRPTRYGYTSQMGGKDVPLVEGLIKHDLVNGGAEVHKFGNGRYGGEGVFVPRSGATEEDDGWLLSFVHDEIEETSELVVVSAKEMSTEPVARIIMPQRVPYGFHGAWIDQEMVR